MRLQGNLRTVYEVLFHLGVIEPVLKKDWVVAQEDLPRFQDKVSAAVRTANECQGDRKSMLSKLSRFDSRTLEFLAMEVAREYAEYYTRRTLH